MEQQTVSTVRILAWRKPLQWCMATVRWAGHMQAVGASLKHAQVVWLKQAAACVRAPK